MYSKSFLSKKLFEGVLGNMLVFGPSLDKQQSPWNEESQIQW